MVVEQRDGPRGNLVEIMKRLRRREGRFDLARQGDEQFLQNLSAGAKNFCAHELAQERLLTRGTPGIIRGKRIDKYIGIDEGERRRVSVHANLDASTFAGLPGFDCRERFLPDAP